MSTSFEENPSASSEKGAASRLKHFFDLASRRQKLGPVMRRMHRAILESFVDLGRPLRKDELARIAPDGDVPAALAELVACDLVVLGNAGQVVCAYPMTTERTKHRITVHRHDIFAPGALYALGISPMFPMLVTIHSRCETTGEPLRVDQHGAAIRDVHPSSAVCVGIKLCDPGACAAVTLGPNLVFFRDATVASGWMSGPSDDRVLLTLEEAIVLSSALFVPLVSDRPAHPSH